MNKSDIFFLNLKFKRYFFLLLALFSYFSSINISGIHADELHYINEMVGERAGGMGGAFTAISDDPSGAFYNPAGLAFAYENQISLSVNTIRYENNKFSNVVGGQDYSVDYQSLFPSFFGVVQTLGPGKFAISVVINNADLAEQYEFISNISTDPLEDNFISLTYDLQDQTTLFGPSYSLQISDTFTIGLSIFGSYRKRKSINSQVTQKNEDPVNSQGIYPFAVFNTNQTKKVLGVVSILGLQFMPGKNLSIGLKGSLESTFSNKFEEHYTQKIASTGSADSSQNLLILGNYSKKVTDYQYAMDYAIGAAFFVSKNFILSADIKMNPAKDYKILVRDLNPSNNNFGYVNNDLNLAEPRYLILTASTETVINGALGMEYYVTPNFPVRLGAFTNFANTKESSPQAGGEHIDLYGGTLGIAWQTANSSISLTSMFQYGTGKSFKYDAVKDATSMAYSFSLTGSSKY